MSTNPSDWGDLYSDKKTLFPGAEEALKEKKQALEIKKKQILKDKPHAEQKVLDIYQQMIEDAFDHYHNTDENKQKVQIPQGMEVYFAQSPQGKWNVFVLVEKEDDVKLITPVFAGLNNFWNRMAHEQAFPCPVNANSHLFIGTPQKLFNKLKHGEHEYLEKENQYKVEDSVTSVFSARPVSSNSKLGEELRQKILNDPSTATFVSARLFYDKCKLKENSQGSDIERSLDYLLMGLRQEFFRGEQGSFTRQGTLDSLKNNKCIPESDINLIKASYDQALNMTFEEKEDAKRTLPAEVYKINTMLAVRKAVLLWEEANKDLTYGDVDEFIQKSYTLFEFMRDNRLQHDHLSKALKNKVITSRGLEIINEINKVLKDYYGQSKGMDLEKQLVSQVMYLPELFSGYIPKYGDQTDDLGSSTVSRSAILISIMRLMKFHAQNSPLVPHFKQHALKLPALLDYKMAAIRELETNGNLTPDALNHILSFTQNDLKEPLHYNYATQDETKARKTHAYEVQGDTIEKYKTLRGDVLKTRILIDFRNKLSEATDKESLQEIVKQLKAQPEYDILKTIQGKPGRALEIFGYQPSSITAFEKMIKDVEGNIENAYRSQLK